MEQKPIKFKKIEIRKPKWDIHPEKSTTNNHEWRKGLFIIFTDQEGNEYDYMPKWDEMSLILFEVEQIDTLNKRLCKESKEREDEMQSNY